MTDIHTVEEALTHPERFRVTIFGSARTKEKDPEYHQVFQLAKSLGSMGINIITGGGPGIMDAANSGLKAGTDGDAKSVGLTIDLPWENEANNHLDINKHFHKFSNRLDHFMALSNVVVIMPGGIGTCLELFYTWQLIRWIISVKYQSFWQMRCGTLYTAGSKKISWAGVWSLRLT